MMLRFCLMLLYLQPILLFAQNCPGSLGDNLFLDGDFGTGPDPILLTDPQIAPGYVFTNQFPQDGFYTILKSSADLPFLPGTWLETVEPTGEDGYFMIVNASFSPDIFYRNEIDDLCPNTVYTASVDILNLIKSDVGNHIDPNLAFLVDGVEVLRTGSIRKSEAWVTYFFTFQSRPNQTTIKFELQNLAAGGAGNDLAIDNISFKPCGPSSEIANAVSFCENEVKLIESGVPSNFAIQWQENIAGSWRPLPNATQPDINVADRAEGDYTFRFVTSAEIVTLDNPKCRVVSNPIDVRIKETVFDFDLPDVFDATLGEPFEPPFDISDALGSVRWITDSAECFNCTEPPFLFLDNTTLIGLAMSADSCLQADTALVSLRIKDQIALPSAFSPNGDDLNDYYFPSFKNRQIIEFFDLKIYDRWGTVLYETQALDKGTRGWDGTLENQLLNPGYYVAVCQYQISSGKLITIRQDVFLSR